MTKKKEANIYDLFKLTYPNKVLEKNFNIKTLIIYILIFLVPSSIISAILNLIVGNNFFLNFLNVIVGFPIIILILSFFLYLFIKAFDKEKINFLKYYLSLLSVIMPIYLILQIITFLESFLLNIFILTLFFYLKLILSVYFLYLIIYHLSIFLKTNWEVIVSSLILLSITTSVISIIIVFEIILTQLGIV